MVLFFAPLNDDVVWDLIEYATHPHFSNVHGATLNQTKPVVSNTLISLTFGWSKTSRGDFHFLQDQNEHIFVHHDKTFIDPWYGPDSNRPYFLHTCNTYQNSDNSEAPIQLFEAWFVYSRKVYSNVITDPARRRWPRGGGVEGGEGGRWYRSISAVTQQLLHRAVMQPPLWANLLLLPNMRIEHKLYEMQRGSWLVQYLD